MFAWGAIAGPQRARTAAAGLAHSISSRRPRATVFRTTVKLRGVSLTRSGSGRRPAPAAAGQRLHHAAELLHQRLIPQPGARLVLERVERLPPEQAITIRAIRSHAVERVRDRSCARDARDGFPAQALGIAGAVEALVVVVDDGKCAGQRLHG